VWRRRLATQRGQVRRVRSRWLGTWHRGRSASRWNGRNSTLLDGDVAKAVAALEQEDGGDLLVIGSTELVRTLVGHDLIDEFRLMIDPIVLGGGKRIFPNDSVLRSFRLLHSEATTTGAILATYAAGQAET
jgi:dihydrofolate reductase